MKGEKTMFAKLKLMIFLLSFLTRSAAYDAADSLLLGDVYSAWTDTGMHLMISDNGTPDDLEDDFICDWEDNREFTITILD